MRVCYKILLVVILSFPSTLLGQQGWILGFAPSLELEENLIGFNARGYYGINEHFCFGPEVTLFPKQEVENNYDLKITELNFNAHYIFEVSHKIGVYPLSGINYTIEQERVSNTSEEEKEEAFGINYGLGVHYNLGKTFAFAEFKGVSGALNDEFITVGVVFVFLKNEKQKSRKE